MQRGCNYGVCTGFGNLLVIDFDVREFYEKVKDQLPETFVTASPSIKNGCHYYYFIEDRECPTGFRIDSKTEVDTDAEPIRLADVQGKGLCVSGPGSIHPDHPNGPAYKVVNDIPITTVKWEFISKLFEPYVKVGTNITGKEIERKPVRYNKKHDSRVEDLKSTIPVSMALADLGVNVYRKGNVGCPFHGSNSGKCLSYSDGDGVWKCFHRGRGGSIIELYAEYFENEGIVSEAKGKGFPKLLDEIEKRHGINTEHHTKENAERTSENEPNLMDIIKASQKKQTETNIIDYPKTEWFLYPLLKKKSINIIAGYAGHGKTLFTMSMLKAIQEQENFLHYENQYLNNVKVYYLDGEMGNEALQERFLKMDYNREDFISLSTDDLYSAGCKEEFDIANKEHQEFLLDIFNDEKVDIIVLDNIISLTSIETISAKEVTAINSFLSRLRNEGFTVIPIHHATKGITSSFYGSVNLITCVDTVYTIKGDDSEDLNITFDYHKYRPLVDQKEDRKKLKNQLFTYNEVLQEWEHTERVNNCNNTGGNDSRLLCLICAYDEKNTKLYKQNDIARDTRVSVKTIERFVQEMKKEGIIAGERNKTYLTECGMKTYFNGVSFLDYIMREIIYDGQRMYYFNQRENEERFFTSEGE